MVFLVTSKLITIKVLKIGTPEIITAIVLKVAQFDLQCSNVSKICIWNGSVDPDQTASKET